MEEIFDVIVIGAGSGGYVSAIKAAKEGLHTAIVEKGKVGGTCLNKGCIPTKAMLHAASIYREMKEGAKFGIISSEIRYDCSELLAYRKETTDRLCQGIERLLKANGVTFLAGEGVLEQDGYVRVVNKSEEKIYRGKYIILATGSKPLELPIPGIGLPGVLTSDEMFQLEHIPKSLTIIGGGIIGVEFASIFAEWDCKVTIIEAFPRLLPNMDREISQNLKMIFTKQGIAVHTSSEVQCIKQHEKQCRCVFIENGKAAEVSSDYVLCAVGRRPNVDGLFGEGLEPQMDQGCIVVDEEFRTSIKNVYAIGDLVKGRNLAYLASAQGKYVVEKIMGKEPSVELKIVPECVYTNPEIASVGITEEEAKKRGMDVIVGRFNMGANGKSVITKEERGFIKVVADKESAALAGVQMMCARATDMIGEFVTAIVNRLTVKQLIKGMRAHPTYNEGVTEALEDVCRKAIQWNT